MWEVPFFIPATVNDKETPVDKHERIKNLLMSSQLGKAIQLLGAEIALINDWQITSDFDSISMEYRYMLQYFGQGVEDSKRSTLYRHLVGRSLLLNDDVLCSLKLPISMLLIDQARRHKNNQPFNIDYYNSALKRYEDIMPLPYPTDDSPQLKQSITEREQILSNLFTDIWISGKWNRDIRNGVIEMIGSNHVTPTDACMIVCAVTLSLLDMFDPQKMLFLGEISNNDNPLPASRALTGFVLAASKYDDILPYFPEVASLISLMSDSTVIQNGIQSIQYSLFFSRETEKIDKKMRDEILPALLKKKKRSSDTPADISDEDSNPDWEGWEKSLKDPAIQKTIHEMMELQMEGADVYISTFAHLKSFPFFKNPGGWFRPFDISQPDVRELLSSYEFKNSPLGKEFLRTESICDSDKYSFCLTYKLIPKELRRQMLDEIFSNANEDLSENSNDSPSAQYRQYARHYIQDLYRFYKLFPRRHEFWNPFESNTNLFKTESLKQLFSTNQFERASAEFLFQKKYYQEAAELFERIIEKNSYESTDWVIWQKMGFTLQKTNRYAEGLEAYTKADILDPDNIWTIKHIAQCWQKLGDASKATEYMRMAEYLSPEDINLVLYTGECLMNEKKYEEALSKFLKVEYEDPDSIRAKRDIAWCAFMNNKYDLSRKYWNSILSISKKTSIQDLVNSGHNEWCSGKIQEAATLYRLAIKSAGYEDVHILIDADRSILISHGIKPIDISLMLDLLDS